MRKEFKVVDPYENELYTYLWESSVLEPKGVVQIIHGAGEHMGRYDNFANYLNKEGYHVVGNDHLGHGKTSNDKDVIYFDDVMGFHKVYEGVKIIRDFIDDRYPEMEVIMFAHSMGSFIGRYTILHDYKRYNQALFSGTGLFSAFNIFVVRTIGSIIKMIKGPKYVSNWFNHTLLDGHIRSMKRNGIINKRTEWITQDKDILFKVSEDPLCHKEFSIGAQLDIIKFIPEIQNRNMIEKSASSTAIFFMSGELDGLGKYGAHPKKLYNLYNDCGYSNVKYLILNNTRHEIINSVDREAHYKTIVEWINRNL